jgi:hypothetical protein
MFIQHVLISKGGNQSTVLGNSSDFGLDSLEDLIWLLVLHLELGELSRKLFHSSTDGCGVLFQEIFVVPPLLLIAELVSDLPESVPPSEFVLEFLNLRNRGSRQGERFLVAFVLC